MAGYVEGQESNNARSAQVIGKIALDPKGYIASLDEQLGNIQKDAGFAVMGMALKKLARNSILGNFVESGLDAIKEHSEREQATKELNAGIKYLADQKVPGFGFHEVQTGGEKYTIAVDATNKLSTPEASPFLIITRADHNHSSHLDPESQRPNNLTETEIRANPALLAATGATVNAATSSLLEFSQNFDASFEQRKNDFLQKVQDWTVKVREAKTQEEIPYQPYMTSSASAALGDLIYTERNNLSDKTIAAAYPEATPEAEKSAELKR